MSYDLKRGTKKRWFLWPAISLLVTLAAVGAWLHWHNHRTDSSPKNNSPVPAAIAQAVNFPVYYPDPKKLPAGYVLDTASFIKHSDKGITYSVDYDNGQKLVFSVQPKASASDLQNFNTSYIPLRIDYQTPIGQAEIGAYNNHGQTESLISLPTDTNAWIIITGPYSIDQSQLKQVLNSLKR
jgi:hypothetical protein